MTGDQAYRAMQKIVTLLNHERPGVINLDSTCECGYGSTVEGFGDDAALFKIGVAGLQGNHKKMSDGKAMVPIMALLHEVCGHGGQLKYEFDKADDLSTLLALNCYACKSSSTYYDGNANPGEFTKRYSRQPYEIAAQYMALASARACLPDIWKEIEDEDGKVVKCASADRDKKAAQYTDQLLLRYVNHRMFHKSEFVHRVFPFTSVDDVLESFENKFRECADAHREYDYREEPYGYVQKQVDRHKSVPSRGISPEMAKRIGVCESGTHQDIMICAAFRSESIDSYLGFHDVFEKPAFECCDLSLDLAFSDAPPWSPPGPDLSPMARLTNMAVRAKRREQVRCHDQHGPDPP